MTDTLTKEERSAQMAKVRCKGNRSTEGRVAAAMKQRGIRGWSKHPKGVEGNPDFIFPKLKLVIFVDGCFWHACPKCGRIPKSRTQFWRAKIDETRRRDNRIRRRLRREGYVVMRIWEHEAPRETWLKRVSRMIRRIQRERDADWGAG